MTVSCWMYYVSLKEQGYYHLWVGFFSVLFVCFFLSFVVLCVYICYVLLKLQFESELFVFASRFMIVLPLAVPFSAGLISVVHTSLLEFFVLLKMMSLRVSFNYVDWKVNTYHLDKIR